MAVFSLRSAVELSILAPLAILNNGPLPVGLTTMANSTGELVADLHLHSQYACPCSKNLAPPNAASTAHTKGGSTDSTHPDWLSDLVINLGRWMKGHLNAAARFSFWAPR